MNKVRITNRAGQHIEIRVGDWVWFESGVDQTAQVTAIRPHNPDGFGAPLRYQLTVANSAGLAGHLAGATMACIDAERVRL